MNDDMTHDRPNDDEHVPTTDLPTTSVDEGLLARLAEGATLPERLSDRYLQLGRMLLSDPDPQTLDERTRERLSRILGKDVSGVRIHTGERAQQAASALGAEAFALGEEDVFFGQGRYAPDDPKGMGLLAHEVAHTAEATQVARPHMAFKGRGGEEGFAEGVESMILAQEESAPAASAVEVDDGARPNSAGFDVTDADFERIVDDAWRKYRENQRLYHERRGLPF